MDTSIQLSKRLLSILTLWALTSLACALSDLLPQPCSDTWLITKITVANGAPDIDTIDLDPGCIYEFDEINSLDYFYGDNALPIITTPIMIHGNGATLRRSAAAGTPIFDFFQIDIGGSLTLDDMTFTNGGCHNVALPCVQSPRGGAISSSGTLKAFNVTFSDNRGTEGGAIFNRGNAEITGSEFVGNHARDGGAILNHGTLTIDNSIFSNNQAEMGGGVILSSFSGIINITLSEFTGNQAGWYGGVIWNHGNINITGSAFSNNQAEKDGGVIFTAFGLYLAEVSVANSTFSGNHTELSGGAIYNGNSILTIETSTIDNNTAKTKGAGIANSGQLSITNSTISSNTLMREWEPYLVDGSAIDHYGSEPLTIRFTTITNNSGISPVPAVSLHGPAEIMNSIVAGNPGGDCGIFGGTISASEANLDSDGTCDGFTLTADHALTRWTITAAPPRRMPWNPTARPSTQQQELARRLTSAENPDRNQRGESAI